MRFLLGPLSLAYRQLPSLSSHHHPPTPYPLPVRVQMCSSYDTPLTLDSSPPSLPHYNLMISLKTLSPNWSGCEALGELGFQHMDLPGVREGTIQPVTVTYIMYYITPSVIIIHPKGDYGGLVLFYRENSKFMLCGVASAFLRCLTQ